MFNPFDMFSKKALEIYKKHNLHSVLLESLIMHNGINVNELVSNTTKVLTEDLKWKVVLPDLYSAINHLMLIRLIEIDNDTIMLTEAGRDAIKNCSFQQLAATSYFNYLTLKVTLISVAIASGSILIALMALIFK